MPRYNHNNYSFVIDSSFDPMSMQELMTPFLMYKDAYEKSEEAYNELSSKSDKFKYLSETLPEGSKARQVYEGYANELSRQAEDLAKHGLSMNNHRALTNLKRRYQGEIGRLDLADEAMQEERKLRRQMNAKDSSMLYALDNLSIDQFLDGQTPNLYNISGNELYSRGAAAGKSASARVYSAGDGGQTLGGYYRLWTERNGYSKERIDAFRANAAAIPELQQAADAILQERGVIENLRENPQALRRARQSVLNGIIDGAVYAESSKPVRDEGVMSAAQIASNALGWANHNESVRQHNLQLKMAGYDENGVYHKENDQSLKKAKAVAQTKSNNKSGTGTKNSKYTQLPKGIRIEWNDDPNEKDAKYSTKEIDSSPSTEAKHEGNIVTYDELPPYAKDKVDALGPDFNHDLHYYYFTPFKSSRLNDTEAVLEVIPMKVATYNGEEDVDMENDEDLEGD